MAERRPLFRNSATGEIQEVLDGDTLVGGGDSPPRQERFIVRTNGDGVADITFNQPFTNPHIALAVESVQGGARATTVEFTNLTSTGVRVATIVQGSNVSLLGLIALSPASLEAANVHVTVTELA